MEGYILYVVLSYLIMIGYVLSYVHDNRGKWVECAFELFLLVLFSPISFPFAIGACLYNDSVRK